MLGWLEWRWLRGIYSPQPRNNRWGGAAIDGCTGQSGAPPDTVQYASHVTQPLGFERFWPLELCLVVAPNSVVPHRTCTVHCPVRLSLLRALCAHCSVHRCQLQSTVALVAVAPLGVPDSPVNYSGAALEKPEGEEFRIVRSWCNGHCLVAHRIVRCARPGRTSVHFAPWIWNLTWSFYWFVLNFYAPVEYII
jgi:hypothetical protein